MTTYIVLDTNVWVYTTRLLSTALGASLLHSTSRGGFRIAMPLVVEMEVRRHVQKALAQAIAGIDTGYRAIETMMGSRDDYQVPSEQEITSRLDKRFEELGSVIDKVDFTLEDAKNALSRVINTTPPNSEKDQQFKDSAIWEAILRLANESDVHFVTDDRAFFKERDPSMGLAPNLAAEISSLHHTVKVYSTLPEFLSILSGSLPPIDYGVILRAIAEEVGPQLDELASESGYMRGGLSNHKISAFLTERPTVLALQFHISFNLPSFQLPSGETSPFGSQEVKGTCGYDLASSSAEDILISEISVYDAKGERVPQYGQSFVYGVGNMVFGRKAIRHQLRAPLQ